MIKRKQSQHFRRVQTKKGRKVVLVNRGVKKRVRISPKDRKIFNLLSNSKLYNIEHGGGIDYDKKGKIERIQVIKGKKFAVDLDEDYEVLYHTHIADSYSVPSPEDILEFARNRKQQVELVFNNGNTYTVVKTPKVRALSKLPATQLYTQLDKVFTSLQKKPNFDKEWVSYLTNKGFKVTKNNSPKKPLLINIKPIEPKGGNV